MKIRLLLETFLSKEKRYDIDSYSSIYIFSPVLAARKREREKEREEKFVLQSTRGSKIRARCLGAAKATLDGLERNGMNERSNGSCEKPPAYGDNLFAVIRMAKETIWRGRQSNAPINCCRNSKTRFTLPGQIQECAGICICVQKWIPSSTNFGRARQKFFHLGGAANVPFSRVVFANWMGPTGRKLFAEIGILFTAFVECRPPGWGRSLLISIRISTYIYIAVNIY